MTATDVTSRRGGPAHLLARALPLPAGAGLARTLVERNARAYRHVWVVLVIGVF